MCGLEPKDKTEKGSFSPISVTSNLRETYNCISMLSGIRNGKRQQSEKEGQLLLQHFCLKCDCRFIPVSSAQTLIMSMETIASQTEARDNVQTSSIEKPVQEKLLKAQRERPQLDKQKPAYIIPPHRYFCLKRVSLNTTHSTFCVK